MIENNKNEVTKSIYEELQKIEDYVEQALFYARSNTVEKDYFIRKVKLKSPLRAQIGKLLINRFVTQIGTNSSAPIVEMPSKIGTICELVQPKWVEFCHLCYLTMRK